MSLKSDLGVLSPVLLRGWAPSDKETRSSFCPPSTMKLIILNDYDQASEWAAKYIRNKILLFKPGPDRYFTLGLPTGE